MSLDLRNRDQSRNDRPVTIGLRGRVRYWVIAIVATLAARRMLARIVKRPRSRGSPHIPPHLLRDIGLPEDYFDPSRRFGDHQ